MANTPEYVSVGKPGVQGGIWRAPVGTALPTDAVTALPAAYVCLGFISEDGVEADKSVNTTEVKAWGGDTVMTTQDGSTDTVAFTMIEDMNLEARKTFYGDSNVSGTLQTGITTKSNNLDLGEHVYVIEKILQGGVLERTVYPRGKVTARGTVKYSDSEIIGLNVTITGLQDSSGNTSYTYTQTAPTATEGD